VQGVYLIFQAVRTVDWNLRNAVMIAIGNLIIAKAPILLTCRPGLLELIDSYFSADLFLKDTTSLGEDDIQRNASGLTGFAKVKCLIKWIFQSYPELHPADFAALIEIRQVFMAVKFTELQTVAISTALQGFLFTGWIDSFCWQLALILENSDSGVVIVRSFKAVSIVIERETPIPPAFIEPFVGSGWVTMDGRLAYQKEEELSGRSCEYIYGFQRVLFEGDSSFRLDKQIQHWRKLLIRWE
jgi:hypothetical protein